jgi:hypothetical protein
MFRNMYSEGWSHARGVYVPTDPQAMRALAHPVRMKLLGLLPHAGTLTATQASEALGESPANCAFHLRTLAKYGFVEEAGGGRGRERPWRRAYASIGVNAFGDDPAYDEAATAFVQLAWNQMMTEAGQAMLARSSWPRPWPELPAAEVTTYLTSDEVAQFNAEFSELLDRYGSRLHDQALRPTGSVPVSVILLAWPKFGLSAELPAPVTDAGDEEN